MRELPKHEKATLTTSELLLVLEIVLKGKVLPITDHEDPEGE